MVHIVRWQTYTHFTRKRTTCTYLFCFERKVHSRRRRTRGALQEGHSHARRAAAAIVEPTTGELLGGGPISVRRQASVAGRSEVGAGLKEVRRLK